MGLEGELRVEEGHSRCLAREVIGQCAPLNAEKSHRPAGWTHSFSADVAYRRVRLGRWILCSVLSRFH
jgi:hypothetical protein